MSQAALAPHANGAANDGRLIETYAASLGMSGKALFDTMVATIFPSGRNAPKATIEHVQALILVAEAYDLNPMTKEIYAFPAMGGGIVPIVSVDGWYKLISRHPESNGYQMSIDFEPNGNVPVSATCKMHRKGWDYPVEVTEYVHECKRDTDPWKKQPVRMIRHRAIVQAARATFGFGGIYEADEGARLASYVPDGLEESREVEAEETVAADMEAMIAEKKRQSETKAAVHADAQAATAGEPAAEEGQSEPEADKAAAKRREVVENVLAQFATRGIGREVIEAEFGDLEAFSREDAQRAADIWMALEGGKEPQDAFGEKATEVLLGAPDLGPDSDEPTGGALFTTDSDGGAYGEDA